MEVSLEAYSEAIVLFNCFRVRCFKFVYSLNRADTALTLFALFLELLCQMMLNYIQDPFSSSDIWMLEVWTGMINLMRFLIWWRKMGLMFLQLLKHGLMIECPLIVYKFQDTTLLSDLTATREWAAVLHFSRLQYVLMTNLGWMVKCALQLGGGTVCSEFIIYVHIQLLGKATGFNVTS